MISRLVLSFFLYGLGFYIPLFGFLFLIPLYQIFVLYSKAAVFVFIFFISLFWDIQEGFFPVNFFILNASFFLLSVQRFLPYQQEKVFYYLGFLSVFSFFVFLKTVVLISFYDFSFSFFIMYSFIVTILMYFIFEIFNRYYLREQERKIRAKR